MRVTNEVKARVKAVIDQCIVTANARYDRTFKYPTVLYTKRGTTAGTARDSTYTVNFNSILLMENIELFMTDTVIHEFAHLVDGIVNKASKAGRPGGKRRPHGPGWQSVMRVLGADPSRCHSMDTTNSKVKRRAPKPRPKQIWECSCGSPDGTMRLGSTRHKKMVSGQSTYWMRGHRHHTYTYVGSNAATPVRLAANAVKPKPARRTVKVTKLDLCRAAYEPLWPRDQMILVFIDKGCTPAGAATYYAKIKKEI